MRKKLIISVVMILALGLTAVKISAQGIGLVDIRYADQVITVGGPTADIPGFTSGAIQIALDAIGKRGGGTVKLNAGTFDILAPVRIPSNGKP